MIEGKDTGFVDYLYNDEHDYLIPFTFQENQDVAVELRLGTEVLELVENIDYTIFEVDTNFFIALTADAEYPFEPEILSIKREMELTQLYHFDSGEPVDRSYLERALDRLILLIQAMTRGISGALFFPTNEDVDPYLPNSTERRGNYLGFDSLGEMEVWVDGYDKVTTEPVHEDALLTDDATDHNTHYGTNDQEQFLPSQEGQIKSSFLATLAEEAAGHVGYLDSAIPGVDYYAQNGTALVEVKASTDPRYEAAVDEDMMFFFLPGQIPAGVSYEVIDEYVGYYLFHDPGYIENFETIGSSSHSGEQSVAGIELWGYGHQRMNGSTGSNRQNVYWLADDYSEVTEHSHTIPQHTHTGSAPNEMNRANLIPVKGFDKLVPGMCCLAPAGENTPEGFSDVTTALGRYLKFVDDTESTFLVNQPTHNHGLSASLTSGGDDEAHNIVEGVTSADPEDLFYGYEPSGTHLHSIPAHTDGEAIIEAPAHNYRLCIYTGEERDTLPNNSMVGSDIGTETFPGTRRIYGYGDYCRVETGFGTYGQAWHDHIKEGLTTGLSSNPAGGGVRSTSDDPAPVNIWGATNHTHDYGDLHSCQDVYPLAVRLNFFLAVCETHDDGIIPTVDTVGGSGVMGELYGLTTCSDTSSLLPITTRGMSFPDPFQYSGADFSDIKIYKIDETAYILGNPSSSFPGHMIVNTAPLAAALVATQRLASAPYNYANSTYCMNVEDKEIHQLLGIGELHTYDILTWTQTRTMEIPAGTYAAEWSDFYFGIVAIMDVDGVYSLVYIRPQEPGEGVYVCDTYPEALEAPKIKALGKDGGICVVFDDDTSPVARLYFDLDKHYDFTLTGAGRLQEVAWLDKISTLKIVCENKSYSTVEGVDIKTFRLPVKSYLPYVDKDVVEWTP